MKRKEYNLFAFDLGATSGRSILGTISDGRLTIRELTRFPNKIIRIGERYYWDIYALYDELKRGLKIASSENITLDSIGIDTWGVDFVYLGEDGSILGQPRSYRDPYTNGAPEEYFNIVPRRKLYDITGIQILNFNSLFQLFAAKKEKSSHLEAAADILFMPDALSYLLTGKKICEYTIASTSQMLNARTANFEASLLEPVGISPSLLQPIVMPGEIAGYVTDSVRQECRIGNVPVIAVAGHDTGSAVAAIPVKNRNFAYLSSGTWSLMGIETEKPIITEESCALNFTNEGGVEGTIRVLKNITGMWLLEQCRSEWEQKGRSYEYADIVAALDTDEACRSLIDPDYKSFACPESMCEAIACYCRKSGQPVPITDTDYMICIFNSLALKYRLVLDMLRRLSPHPIEVLHVIGGGSKNALLNQMTANSIGIPVVAGPGEATVIGNIMMQAKGLGLVGSLEDMRRMIADSTETVTYTPENSAYWESLRIRFDEILTRYNNA